MSEALKPKVGDTVLVRAEISYLEDKKAWVSFSGKLPTCVDRANIVSIEPRPLKVGDRVTVGKGCCPVVICAIEDDEAWVKYEDGSHKTWELSYLERVT